MRQITLALTHYNRLPLLLECFAQVLDDPRIQEIVISDDASTDGSYEKLMEMFPFNVPGKVRVLRNLRNEDCYRNKKVAVLRSSLDWVVLFDSDNVLTPSYLDRLYEIPEWDPSIVYCPDFAEPHFNYSTFAGQVIDHTNIARLMVSHLPPSKKGSVQGTLHPPFLKRKDRLKYGTKGDKLPRITTSLNTCNFFVHRASYLAVWDGSVDPHTADSMFQMLNWLKSGRKIFIVPNLRYYHRIHDLSHYKLNWRKTGSLAREIEEELKKMI